MKSILITGAYGGMGYATVQLMKKAGMRVFALDVKVGEAEENVIPIKADITSEESVKEAFERVSRETDTLLAVLHFVGIYMLDSFVEMESDAFDRIFDVNFRGVYLVNRIFMPLLKENSRILITTSELAVLDPLPFTGIYAISKAALDKYAYSLAMELQLLGIRVSVLRAGAVATGMLGVSTDALDRFCEKTERFSPNADRFRRVVASVEARSIAPERIAKKAEKILSARRPRFAYAINRNPLLLLLNLLPKRWQLFIIGRILK